jgi:hypothetical protein
MQSEAAQHEQQHSPVFMAVMMMMMMMMVLFLRPAGGLQAFTQRLGLLQREGRWRHPRVLRLTGAAQSHACWIL